MKIYIGNTESSIEAELSALRNISSLLTFQKTKTKVESLCQFNKDRTRIKFNVGLLPYVFENLAPHEKVQIFDLRNNLPIFDKVVTGIKSFDFFDHQKEMVAKANNFIALPKGANYSGYFATKSGFLYFPRGVYDAATGSGKTAVMVGIMLSFLQPQPFVHRAFRDKISSTPIKGVQGTNKANVLCLINAKLSFTSLTDGFEKMLGTTIGKITAEDKPFFRPFTLGMYQTVANRIEKDRLFADTLNSYFNVLFVDECHYGGAENFYELLGKLKIHSRYFFSGTPFNFEFDARKFRLVGQSGTTLHAVENTHMIQKGVSLLPVIRKYEIPYSEQLADYRGDSPIETFLEVIAKNKMRNRILFSESNVEDGLCVISYRYKAHGQMLFDYANRYYQHVGIKKNIVLIDGDVVGGERKAILDACNSGKVDILIASTVLKEAVNIPSITKLILAAPSGAEIYINQLVGRATRTYKDHKQVIIVDFLDKLRNYPEMSTNRDSVFLQKGGEIYYFDHLGKFLRGKRLKSAAKV